MIGAASRRVAIWIDAHEAILFAFEVNPLDRLLGHRLGDGWSHERVDAHLYSLAQQYYQAVLSYLRPEDEILIMGPGQAKLELRHQIEQQGGLKGEVVGLCHACNLAKVEVVFPTRNLSRSDAPGVTQGHSFGPQPVAELAERE